MSTRRLARTRGALSGILLVLLGAWAALAPFIGPLFNFGFTPDTAWHWTAARGWYEVLPGAVAFVGGLLLLMGTSRMVTVLGSWLAAVAGGWLVIGPAVSTQLTLGDLGTPMGHSGGVRVLEEITFFYLVGAVIIFLAAAAFGRLSVVTVRDVRVAERRAEAEQAAAAEAAEREAAERETAQRRAAEREAAEREAAEREAAARNAPGRDRADAESAVATDQPVRGAASSESQSPYHPYPNNPYDQPRHEGGTHEWVDPGQQPPAEQGPGQQQTGYPSAPPPPPSR